MTNIVTDNLQKNELLIIVIILKDLLQKVKKHSFVSFHNSLVAR